MADFKVSVSIIEPSYFATGLVQSENVLKLLTDSYNNLPDDIKEEYGQEYFEAGNF